jgi:XTP/dITP diphosphohydrolase
MELILATSNPHKAEEFNELLKNSNLKIISAEKSLDVVENGDTFLENALIKAKAYFEKYQKPILSDDSGLVVLNLPHILGVNSARFEPELKDYKDKCAAVIKQCEKIKDRSAYFVCVLCVYLNPQEIYFFEGRVHGKIGDEYRGEHGFGYDPIFIPDSQNKTLAELPEWKNLNSHRAKASLEMQNFFLERNLQNP